MNWEVIHSYLPRYIDAFRLTVRTGLIGIGIALILGIVCAFFMHFRIPGFSPGYHPAYSQCHSRDIQQCIRCPAQ